MLRSGVQIGTVQTIIGKAMKITLRGLLRGFTVSCVAAVGAANRMKGERQPATDSNQMSATALSVSGLRCRKVGELYFL
jgi:hypothetical protein